MIAALTVMGAVNAMMRMENIRIEKESKNRANRAFNCDQSNLRKQLAKAKAEADMIGEYACTFRTLLPDVPVLRGLGKDEEVLRTVRRLMAIPPACVRPEENRPFFLRMKQLFIDNSGKKYDNVSMDFLSMGMSGDYAEAIACGANLVRVGTAIFGPRDGSRP